MIIKYLILLIMCNAIGPNSFTKDIAEDPKCSGAYHVTYKMPYYQYSIKVNFHSASEVAVWEIRDLLGDIVDRFWTMRTEDFDWTVRQIKIISQRKPGIKTSPDKAQHKIRTILTQDCGLTAYNIPKAHRHNTKLLNSDLE